MTAADYNRIYIFHVALCPATSPNPLFSDPDHVLNFIVRGTARRSSLPCLELRNFNDRVKRPYMFSLKDVILMFFILNNFYVLFLVLYTCIWLFTLNSWYISLQITFYLFTMMFFGRSTWTAEDITGPCHICLQSNMCYWADWASLLLGIIISLWTPPPFLMSSKICAVNCRRKIKIKLAPKILKYCNKWMYATGLTCELRQL